MPTPKKTRDPWVRTPANQARLAREVRTSGPRESNRIGRSLGELGIRQEPGSFGGSCLQVTMSLAATFRATLSERLAGVQAAWPYEDRVLVWLDSGLESSVREFHDGDGEGLVDLLRAGQLTRLDRAMARRLIVRIGEEVVGRCLIEQFVAGKLSRSEG
jgi:hypothetical protein